MRRPGQPAQPPSRQPSPRVLVPPATAPGATAPGTAAPGAAAPTITDAAEHPNEIADSATAGPVPTLGLLIVFLGTLVLIALGDGVVAMVVLFGEGVPGEIVHGGYTNITLG